MKKITRLWQEWRLSMLRKRLQNEQKELQAKSVDRFNIVKLDGIPVITYMGTVISVPDEEVTGDQIIQNLFRLRQIFVEKSETYYRQS